MIFLDFNHLNFLLFQYAFINYIGSWQEMRISEGMCRVKNVTVGSDCCIASGMQCFVVSNLVIFNANLKIYSEKFEQLVNKVLLHFGKSCILDFRILSYGSMVSALIEHRPQH